MEILKDGNRNRWEWEGIGMGRDWNGKGLERGWNGNRDGGNGKRWEYEGMGMRRNGNMKGSKTVFFPCHTFEPSWRLIATLTSEYKRFFI